MKTIYLSVILLIFLAPVNSHGQYLNGNILSESGGAAASVSVNFKNNKNTVLTNADGSFKILATVFPDTLVFTSPGYEPYTVVVTEKDLKDPKFEVVLLNKRTELSEVVVVGYGTTRRKTITGSVTTVSGKEIASVKRGKATRFKAPAAASVGYASEDEAVRSYDAFETPGTISPKPEIINPSINSLTAGEVNDFYKWTMWTDLTSNYFNDLSKHWQFYPKRRFTVQVQNADYVAIVNHTVHLVNKKTNITSWTAVTDNTGKAELWGGLNDNDSLSDYMIIDDLGNKIANASPFQKSVNHMTVKQHCNSSNEVDIAFVVDATGSMGDEIEFLKFELEDVVRKTYEDYNNLDVKTSAVFYRDNGDAYVTRSIDFQSELLKVLNFVKLQSAGGGGDGPEAVDSALHVALEKLSWRKTAKTKLLFLILDAPPHDQAITDLNVLIKKAAAMGVRIIPIGCSGSDKSNEFLLRSMALATNGTYTFLTDHSGIGGKHVDPTTDNYSVESLNGLMKRIIRQFIYTKDCNNADQKTPFIQGPTNVLKVKIFPNPSKGPITIESSEELKEVFVADFTGKILMKLTSQKSKTWKTDISNYPSGTYLVKYITKDDRWGAEQLVLIH